MPRRRGGERRKEREREREIAFSKSYRVVLKLLVANDIINEKTANTEPKLHVANDFLGF